MLTEVICEEKLPTLRRTKHWSKCDMTVWMREEQRSG